MRKSKPPQKGGFFDKVKEIIRYIKIKKKPSVNSEGSKS